MREGIQAQSNDTARTCTLTPEGGVNFIMKATYPTSHYMLADLSSDHDHHFQNNVPAALFPSNSRTNSYLFWMKFSCSVESSDSWLENKREHGEKVWEFDLQQRLLTDFEPWILDCWVTRTPRNKLDSMAALSQHNIAASWAPLHRDLCQRTCVVTIKKKWYH